METHTIAVTDPQTTPDTFVQSVQPSSYRHMSLAQFRPNPAKKECLNRFGLELYTYLWLKYQYLLEPSSAHTFCDMQEFFVLTKPKEDEKSNIVYFDVLDAITDNKETVLLVLHKLRKDFIEGQGKQWLVVAGDAKLYNVLKLIHHEYGEEFKWLIPYPGDWHTLGNYQKALLKLYFDAGLKELAKTAGYPTAQIQACSQFKRTHLFIMMVWEALFLVMLEGYISENSSTAAAHALKLELLSNPQAYQAQKSVTTLQTCLSHEYDNFILYLEKKSIKSDNWKFWSQFVIQHTLDYILQ